ncbi:MAG: NAD+ synthase [Dehalococcoidales bacterium]|nr:NAD+ synthase [Dehalococcoidales bacterium]
MSNIKISMNQINTKVGALDYNSNKIIEGIKEAESKNCDIVCFPELTITGYPPEDLVLSNLFVENNLLALKKIIKHTKNITSIIGFIDQDKNGIYNAAAIISNTKIIATYRKNKLPNYGVFDEKRYFSKGNEIVILKNKEIKIGISICEDIWEDYEVCKIESDLGCNVLININGSPFDINKKNIRDSHLSNVAKDCNSHLIYINCIGGQDDLIFDGSSSIFNNLGEKIISLPSFKEKNQTINIDISEKKYTPYTKNSKNGYKIIEKNINFNNSNINNVNNINMNSYSEGLEDILSALVLGTKDYAEKNGFSKCLISLSGGIDSALVTVIASKALGAENIKVVNLPSKYSSDHSITDSEKLCENLGLNLINIPILNTHEEFLKSLNFLFKDTEENNAEENLQARIRGNFIMAISNKFSWLVLSTGNKSEMATGYATLYGDMAGGFSVLKDVPKTLVYQLSNYINEVSIKEIIPQNIINKLPSAELKSDQFDKDTLPDYDILDQIMESYIEEKNSVNEILKNQEITKNISESKILEILSMIDRNEYKRRQSAPGIKITPLAFGRDRRYPIASQYKYTYRNFPSS